MSFEPIVSFDTLPKNIATRIAQEGRWIIEAPLDLTAGSGVIGPYSRCVWTKTGKRVTVFLKDAFIVSQSKDVDPLYAERVKA